jgi:hypothetical protein
MQDVDFSIRSVSEAYLGTVNRGWIRLHGEDD